MEANRFWLFFATKRIRPFSEIRCVQLSVSRRTYKGAPWVKTSVVLVPSTGPGIFELLAEDKAVTPEQDDADSFLEFARQMAHRTGLKCEILSDKSKAE